MSAFEEAARNVNALAQEHGLDGALEHYGIDLYDEGVFGWLTRRADKVVTDIADGKDVGASIVGAVGFGLVVGVALAREKAAAES